MCNEMDGEFDGKVCHVELGKQTQVSKEGIDHIDKYKCGGCSRSGARQGICFFTIVNIFMNPILSL
jgi:hypothetical protein